MVLDEVLEDTIVLATQHLAVKMTIRVPQADLSRTIIDYQSSLGKKNGRSGSTGSKLSQKYMGGIKRKS